MQLFTLTISNKHGQRGAIHTSREAAEASLAEHWREERPARQGGDEFAGTNEEAIEAYYGYVQDIGLDNEWAEIDEHNVLGVYPESRIVELLEANNRQVVLRRKLVKLAREAAEFIRGGAEDLYIRLDEVLREMGA